jgi:hypothetical protein
MLPLTELIVVGHEKKSSPVGRAGEKKGARITSVLV